MEEDKGSKFWYSILNAVLSTVLFVALYKVFVEQLPTEPVKYGWILITMVGTGIIADLIAHAISKHWEIRFNLRILTKYLLNAAIYALLIYVGIISQIFAKYPLFPPLGNIFAMSTCLYLIILKVLVNLLADSMTNSFGRKLYD